MTTPEIPKQTLGNPGGEIENPGFQIRITGQYPEARAVLFEQAGQLARLGTEVVPSGKEYIGHDGKPIRVDTGYTGVVVTANGPDDVDRYWETLDELEKTLPEV